MANVKISDLRASSPAAALTGAEAIELTQGGVSKGGLISQVPTYLNTISPLLLGNSSVSIAANGININLGLITLATSGQGTFANGAIVLSSGGGATFGNGLSALNSDGSASFVNGAVAIDVAGNLSVASGDVFLPLSTLHRDGRIEITSPGQGITLQSPNGTQFLLTVDNAGQLVIT